MMANTMFTAGRRAVLQLAALAGLAVSAGVAGAAGCSVSATALAFGSYNPFSAAANDSTGSLTITCTVSGTSYTVALSSGAGSYSQRLLTSAGHTLNYNLYSDTARSVIWGDGVGGASSTVAGTAVNQTIYGRIAAGQNAYVGTYADSITVTVDY